MPLLIRLNKHVKHRNLMQELKKKKKERKNTSKLVKDEYSLGYTNILLKKNFLKCKKYRARLVVYFKHIFEHFK